MEALIHLALSLFAESHLACIMLLLLLLLLTATDTLQPFPHLLHPALFIGLDTGLILRASLLLCLALSLELCLLGLDACLLKSLTFSLEPRLFLRLTFSL